jgi:hypothetical protein
VIGGDRAGEVTGGDERTDGRARVVRGRATREIEREGMADGRGRPVSGRGGAAQARAGAWGMGRVGRAGNVARGGEERRLSRIRPSREGGKEIFFFYFCFYFSFSLIFFSFEQIFIYISWVPKKYSM